LDSSWIEIALSLLIAEFGFFMLMSLLQLFQEHYNDIVIASITRKFDTTWNVAKEPEKILIFVEDFSFSWKLKKNSQQHHKQLINISLVLAVCKFRNI